MGVHWPQFVFSYRLDIQKLLPYMSAIAGYQGSASGRVMPPGWRERREADEDEFSFAGLPAEEGARIQVITRRKFELLVRNAGKLQAWVRERFVPGSAPLALEEILMMHRMAADESGLRDENVGTWRTTSVIVGSQEVGGIHAGAPAQRLPRLMEQYVRFINGEELRRWPATVHALVAHFFFTTLHPFADGNGRLGRLVSAAVLFQRGYNGHGFYALSRYFYRNNAKYYALLHSCWNQPLPFDLTLFVAFGMEGFALELEDMGTFVKMKLTRDVEREILTPALMGKARSRGW